jgi:hypothetical protein
MKTRRILWIAGAMLVAMILNVLAFVLWMVIYGYVVNPGQPDSFYQQRAQEMGPYCSIVTGIPIFFAVSYFLTRKWEAGFAIVAAFAFWLLYAIVDVSILVLSGWGSITFSILVFVSMATEIGCFALRSIAGEKEDFSLNGRNYVN